MSQSRLAWNSNSVPVSDKKGSLGKHFAKKIKPLNVVEGSNKKRK